MWLRDEGFLRAAMPYARVLLFGYNSNVAFKSSTAGVREQAENLLNMLEEARTVCPRDHLSRPQWPAVSEYYHEAYSDARSFLLGHE
jgi:hypothetical protein